MDIYWIEQKQKKGPAPEVVIISMLESGELSPETLSWHKGCSGWIPLSDLPALSSFFAHNDDGKPVYKPENTSPSKDGDTPGGEDGAGEAQAATIRVLVIPAPTMTARVAARFLDFLFYWVLILYILKAFAPDPVAILTDKNGLFTLCFWIPYVLIEALLLKAFGTTPGKRLMRVRVRSLPRALPGEEVPSGNAPTKYPTRLPQISWTQSLLRSLFVMVFGLGFFIPLLTVFCGLFSWILYKQQGFTRWDRATQTVVEGKKPEALDWIRFTLWTLVLLMIMGSITQAWTPQMMEFLKSQSL